MNLNTALMSQRMKLPTSLIEITPFLCLLVLGAGKRIGHGEYP